MTAPNPALIKADLRIHGCRIHPATLASLQQAVPGDLAGRQCGVEVVLPEDVCVRLHLDGENHEGPFELTGTADDLRLTSDAYSIEIRLVPPPEFIRRSTRSGRPMADIATIQAGALCITPQAGCSIACGDQRCPYCRDGSDPSEPIAATVEEVLEVVQAAFNEGAADFVYFNLPGSSVADRGIAALDPYVSALKHSLDSVVAIALHPPETNQWIDRAYALGVDAISFNLDSCSDASTARLFPGRVDGIPRDRYFDALGYAAGVFPSGTVWSEVLLGIDSEEATREAIAQIVRLGAIPVVNALPRAQLKALGIHEIPDREATDRLLRELFESAFQAKLNLGWVRDLAWAITPFEARWSSPDGARASLSWHQLYRSKLGGLAARNLARLRRRLRVRRVSDSLDSSHL